MEHCYVRIVTVGGGEIQPWTCNQLLDQLCRDTDMSAEHLLDAALLNLVLMWQAHKAIARDKR